MSEAALILRIRNRVRDAVSPYTYDDNVYRYEIANAVDWVNIRVKPPTPIVYVPGGTPSGLESVGSPYSYFIFLKAAAELALMRGSEGVEGSESSTSRTELELPNLRIEKEFKNALGPRYWMDLAKALEAEIEALLEEMPERGALVQSVYATRRSIVTGGRMVRELDSALPASTLSGSAVGRKFTMSWTIVKSVYFRRYNLVRINADNEYIEEVRVFYDNHIDSVIFTVNKADTYRLQLWTVNGNELVSKSNVVVLTVA
jgi:hypothetical protein